MMTPAIATPIFQTELQSLEQRYVFRAAPEVVQFVEQYPFLLEILQRAPEKIRSYFPKAQLGLQVVPDPEIADYEQLVLSICMTLDPDEAVDRQHKLDQAWWWNLSPQARKHLCILLEYPGVLTGCNWVLDEQVRS